MQRNKAQLLPSVAVRAGSAASRAMRACTKTCSSEFGCIHELRSQLCDGGRQREVGGRAGANHLRYLIFAESPSASSFSASSFGTNFEHSLHSCASASAKSSACHLNTLGTNLR